MPYPDCRAKVEHWNFDGPSEKGSGLGNAEIWGIVGLVCPLPMKSSFRRFSALAAVFLVAFLVVVGLRLWWAGDDLTGWFSRFGSPKGESGQFRPEKYSLPQTAPLDLGDVGLLARLNDEYANLTRAVVPSVVSINTEKFQTARTLDFYGRVHLRPYSSTGQGSGVIVTSEGHVLTNHHVIAGQQKINVTLHDGRVLPARVIGEDKFLDIAVLKIDGEGSFVPLKIGDSSEVQVGQMVFAVGNPFGLGETVTQGIISAKERSLSDGQRDLFQTDAAINPGNSGGPLVNLRGEIIGINVAIYSPDKENPGFQGVGFSIPSNDVRDSMTQILERGRPVRGFLGVQMRDLDPAIRSALGYSGNTGTVVMGVSPGSPAEQAGLKAGDVIVTLNGKKIGSYAQLFSLVQTSRVGQAVRFEVWRKGQVSELKAVIAESAPSEQRQPAADASPLSPEAREVERVLQAMGIEVRELSVPERMRGFRGVVVMSLTPNGFGSKVLRRGDLIMAIHGSRISSAGDFFMQLVSSSMLGQTPLLVLRSGESLQVSLPAVPRE